MAQAGDHCEASLDVPGVVLDDVGNDVPWQASGSIDYPGPPAIDGAGFAIQAYSDLCGPVTFTEEPESFAGQGNGDLQESSEHGNLQVCSGCITQSCNDLIP